MDIDVELGGRGDLAAGIYRFLLDAILDGRLRPGERLPPTREMAGRLGVSRNTVTGAYDRLTAEGFLVGRTGAGTYVCPRHLIHERPRAAPAGRGLRPRALWETLAAQAVPMRTPGDVPLYDFRFGSPDPELFPLEPWRRMVTRELRRANVRVPGYADPAGHPGLRSAIARHVGVSRAVRAGDDDVLITNGAQQALDLIGRVLVEPGDVVAVEDPGYPPARELFSSLGARVAGVPVDHDGLDVSALPAGARLVYVTPSHQFPLGTPMSLPRRAALLAWAERHDAVIVEDDYDSDYRFECRPLEPLQSIDASGRVIYIGTFSKALLPMLRLGYLIAPASLQPALRTAKQLTDWHGDQTSQAALAAFIDEGLLSRHLRKATQEYATRRETLLAALHTHFAGTLDVIPSCAGLHVSARLTPGTPLDLEAALTRAHTAGLALDPLTRFYATHPQPGLILGYGLIHPDRIEKGISLLADTFRQ
ncbi:GntR family transcriptional regulator [Acrocarpospora phusangensis]|uniref:GntR family transcriptional regulator n=1 Tax=Acrocarpospora phusangensis TaxID=1070424 RepID=A0A919Q845_9ACTN|nr:PLP-dependent aminotransferase family protein [Acrocarpospora phusangensis]GIH24209.1 GntR family transcriptional regulator [Acrocarpospora phusangensis]